MLLIVTALRKVAFLIATAITATVCTGVIPIVSATPPEGVPASAAPLTVEGKFPLDAWVIDNLLYVPVADSTSTTGLTIPRLANIVLSVHWLSDESTKLSVQPEPDHWVIKVGKAPENKPAIVEFTLDSSARAFDSSILAEPSSENLILLPAQIATTRGENLRFEPQPHKNTIGYWSQVRDTAEWQFRVKTAGMYEIDILQGCGKGHGGSSVELQVASTKLNFEVQETGHFQNFIWRKIGTVQLSESENATLRLVPLTKAAGAVMDVRAVRLCPAGMTRSFTPELADPESLPESLPKSN